MPLDMVLLSTLIGSNYPCLELIFMVPKVLEPLKCDCIFIQNKNEVHIQSAVNISNTDILKYLPISFYSLLGQKTLIWPYHLSFRILTMVRGSEIA